MTSETNPEDQVRPEYMEKPGGAMRFDGSSGQKPQTEARRYVYRCFVDIIDKDSMWFTNGITNEFDRRRLTKALEAVRREMTRKGG